MIKKIHPAKVASSLKLPLYSSHIKAGFPSPADDFIDKNLDLNEHLVKHPAATFYVRAQGDSMLGAGILPGSILIVDRSIEPRDGRIVVVILDGEFTVKRLKKRAGKVFLVAENPKFPAVEVLPGRDFEVWGVVVHVIHSV